jgi:hypothetical protein
MGTDEEAESSICVDRCNPVRQAKLGLSCNLKGGCHVNCLFDM